ncbi:MAG TPA: YrzE family protein [Paraburkholderia sp.]|jgi:hypothetical protein
MRFLVNQEGLPRVSWGAVFTGVILSVVVYLIFSVLGIAIGASLLNPLSQPNPTRAFGFGSGVWLIVATVVSVFVGSYFAGRCAPVLGWLHGLLAWAVMLVFVAFSMASAAGGALSVAGNLAATGATVGATAARDGSNSGLNALSQQAQTAIATLGAAASSPQAEADARQAADTAARTVARASWFSFAALFVGAVIAIGAGGLGFRHQPAFEAGRKTILPDNRGVVGSGGVGENLGRRT